MSANEPSTPTDDLGFPLPPPAQGSRIGVFIVLAVIVGAVFAFGYFRRQSVRHDAAADEIAPAAKTPRVEVIKPTVLSSDQALLLPGTVKPLEETQVFARVPGYVRAWHADIGDK